MLEDKDDEDESLNDENAFNIFGNDLLYDVSVMIDLLDPIVLTMIRAQSLQTPMWKVTIFQGQLNDHLADINLSSLENLPTLKKNIEEIKKLSFEGRKIFPGWLVVTSQPATRVGKSKGK